MRFWPYASWVVTGRRRPGRHTSPTDRHNAPAEKNRNRASAANRVMFVRLFREAPKRSSPNFLIPAPAEQTPAAHDLTPGKNLETPNPNDQIRPPNDQTPPPNEVIPPPPFLILAANEETPAPNDKIPGQNDVILAGNDMGFPAEKRSLRPKMAYPGRFS